MTSLRSLLDHPRTDRWLMILILINAVVLGLETHAEEMPRIGPLAAPLGNAILGIFAVELAAKILVHRLGFFKNVWNLFDFAVIAIALVPASGPLAVLRTLRVLRVLRLITVVPSLKRVVGALFSALPNIGGSTVLLGLIFYVSAVMATEFYGETFPEWFGNIFASAYSLFQIMTLEGWSMGIVRPVMNEHPMAWAFFLPFILCTTFTALNLFIGVVVQAMQDGVHADQHKATSDNQQEILDEVRCLRLEVAALRNDPPPDSKRVSEAPSGSRNHRLGDESWPDSN
ncbi:ion transporter [Thioalkalivibrio sp. HK1]|uniref:ion transporter n=1 Tax=Thioalkalivibrio sp. HK1 TaxID=1469245 RepID=UPI00046F8B6C|nr:ion transporter [Thioalkalivibrio sp. HK1]